MKHALVLAAALGVFSFAAPQADAFGRRSRCGGNDCGAPVSCCEPQPCAGPAYIEKTVTAYRPVYKQKTVPTEIRKIVSKVVEEPFKYTEMVAEVTPQKRTETYYTQQMKEVPYKYTVMVPVVTPEKRTINYFTCVPEKVTKEVPVCRVVPVKVVDPCSGCCYTVCKRVTEMQTVTCTVMKPVPQTREVTINVCSYKAEEKTGTRQVCETVPQTREVTVNVCNYKPVERTGTRKRLVCETVKETVDVTQTYCEMESYQTTIRVPTGACGDSGCGYDEGCRSRRKCGLLARLCGR